MPDAVVANLYKNCFPVSAGVPMKKAIAVIVLLFLTASVAASGTVPRIVIQSPQQVKIFIHPPICKNRELPSIPNYGVIYLQVRIHNADRLYIELNGQPIRDEFGNIIYYPEVTPEELEIIPLYIEDQFQHKACYVMARAENENGANTVYAAFIPIPAGKGEKVPTYGCTSMY